MRGLGVWNELFQEGLSRLRVEVAAGNAYRKGCAPLPAGSVAVTSTPVLLAVVPGVLSDT